jgi:CBS domain-containing protein
MSIADILNVKGRKVVTIAPSAHVSAAAHLLRIERIGAVLVSQDDRHIEGILSERDIVQGLTEFGGAVIDQPVSALMSRHVVTCGPDASIAEVMRLMTQHRVRHVPVVADGKLSGIVSIGDVVKSRLQDMELETSVLRDFAVAHH